jgi:hypothetical protein
VPRSLIDPRQNNADHETGNQEHRQRDSEQHDVQQTISKTVAVKVSAPVIACTSELVVTSRSSVVSAVTRDIRSPRSVLATADIRSLISRVACGCSFRTWEGSRRSRFSSLALASSITGSPSAPSSNASPDLARTGGHL